MFFMPISQLARPSHRTDIEVHQNWIIPKYRRETRGGRMDANLLGIGNLNANSPPHKRSLTLAMTFSFGLQPFIYLKHQGLGYSKRKDLLVIILFLLNVFLLFPHLQKRMQKKVRYILIPYQI